MSNVRVNEGDRFECSQCGMAVLVVEPCKCENGEPFFSCCGEQMSMIESSDADE